MGSIWTDFYDVIIGNLIRKMGEVVMAPSPCGILHKQTWGFYCHHDPIFSKPRLPDKPIIVWLQPELSLHKILLGLIWKIGLVCSVCSTGGMSVVGPGSFLASVFCKFLEVEVNVVISFLTSSIADSLTLALEGARGGDLKLSNKERKLL